MEARGQQLEQRLTEREREIHTRQADLATQENRLQQRAADIAKRQSEQEVAGKDLFTRETALLHFDRQVKADQMAVTDAKLSLLTMISDTGGYVNNDKRKPSLTDFRDLTRIIAEKYEGWMRTRNELQIAREHQCTARVADENTDELIRSLKDELLQERELTKSLQRQLNSTNETTVNHDAAARTGDLINELTRNNGHPGEEGLDVQRTDDARPPEGAPEPVTVPASRSSLGKRKRETRLEFSNHSEEWTEGSAADQSENACAAATPTPSLPQTFSKTPVALTLSDGHVVKRLVYLVKPKRD